MGTRASSILLIYRPKLSAHSAHFDPRHSAHSALLKNLPNSAYSALFFLRMLTFLPILLDDGSFSSTHGIAMVHALHMRFVKRHMMLRGSSLMQCVDFNTPRKLALDLHAG